MFALNIFSRAEDIQIHFINVFLIFKENVIDCTLQGKMVLHLSKEMSARLLKHVVRCYLRLSDNPRYMSFYFIFFNCFFFNLHLKCRPGTPFLLYLWKKWHICLILIWVKIQAAKSIPFMCVVFSSPEPTAQVSFSDQNWSVVRHCSWCRCRKLFT